MHYLRTTAYAVASSKEIFTRTIGPTARSAMINWLVAEAKIFVANNWSNHQIEYVFDGYAETNGVRVIEVEVIEKIE